MTNPGVIPLQEQNPLPSITIVVPCFNAAPFIESCLDSLRAQHYPALQVIIADGGSTDGTLALLEKHRDLITVLIPGPDRGQSHAINKGLERATGTLFNWLNADDVLPPGALSALARAYSEHPAASYIAGYMGIIDVKGNLSEINTPPKHLQGARISPHDLLSCLANLKTGPQIGALMRTDLVKSVNGTDETLHYVMDVDLLLRIHAKAEAYALNELTIYYRRHPDAKTSKPNLQAAQERFRILSNLSQVYRAHPRWVKYSATSAAHSYAAYVYTRNGWIIRGRFHRTATSLMSAITRCLKLLIAA
jgi:glycosyltransferase involved in cell wall biosynthesis